MIDADFCRALPKCDLHIHLNGSFRRETINEFADEKHVPHPSFPRMNESIEVIYSKVFKTFGDVHHLTSSLEATKRLAKELVEDAVTDGVIYTEVRTTPKAFTEPEASRRDYLDAVCSTIASTCAASKKFVRAGVLVSVNRGNSVDDAEDAVNLAYEFSTKKNPIVVGLELSGDPFKNDFSSYAPVFLKARSLGIQTSIHFAESNIKEGEMAEMLDTDPQRIGHGIYLDNATAERLAREPKPIECCLSSSVFTNAISGYDKHPAFTQLKKRNNDYPVVICTDDYGIFDSPLSNEYLLAAKYYGLSRDDLIGMARNSVLHSFTPTALKKEIMGEFESRLKSIINK